MGWEPSINADSKPQPSYTPASIWWACWAGTWTAVVASGMAYLIAHRKTPTLRIRGIGLSLSSVALLHVYWTVVQFGMMIGVIMPEDAEYWIMGTYLPCGIALFHASNSRFLHVAKRQQKYADRSSRVLDSPADSEREVGVVSRFCRLQYTTRALVLTSVAILVQLFLTVLMWILSRKQHHPGNGLVTEVHGAKIQQKSGIGLCWKWWPSVLGQFFWSWVVAPIILWKSRNIHDTQGWRIQTIGCAVASLPATPMWLIAIYVPAMESINRYWLPPQWICLSIWFLEVFTILLPCTVVMRQRSLREGMSDSFTQWEPENETSGAEGNSLSSASTLVQSVTSGWKSPNAFTESNPNSLNSMLSMSALEHLLKHNPVPLQTFCSLHDFSGENVAFLTSVARWKTSLPPACWDHTTLTDDNVQHLVQEQFYRALCIYVKFVSVRHAEFPVNISSQDLKALGHIFDAPAQALYGSGRRVDPAIPFTISDSDPEPPVSPEGCEMAILRTASSVNGRSQYWSGIPETFSARVFDRAEESIKYLIFTNTWPKFVRSGGIFARSSAAE
ncbi:hypothetical protein Asppvi_002040 [Aspergillus pseudoviridinutans]|uniref:RGS domain-containing protein n=1 Tax=Aspergillus pseudoviridinutans TaxID=1517512 RepID=A0A9P3BK09_9EURO|nr:uncharacterized protein Asppvi_002040 [Aspergillus pseudoviridinutans]GIJ92762.1 hypothetical protein Asppvi_002040 [Aspergillus pseudoviridinutans]